MSLIISWKFFVVDSGFTLQRQQCKFVHMANYVILIYWINYKILINEIMVAKRNESMKSWGQGKVEGSEIDLMQLLLSSWNVYSFIICKFNHTKGGEVLFRNKKL